MTRNEYQRAVRCFAPDPSLRERVAAAAEQGRRPRHVRPLRAALIAAALCLALVGTAVGAVQVFSRVELINEVHEPLRSGYSVMGSVDWFDLAQFSQTLQGDAENGTHTVGMGDWQSVKDYLGLPLMGSTLLSDRLEHLQILVDGNPFAVTMFGLENGWVRKLEDGELPQAVNVSTIVIVDNWVVRMDVFAATEYADLEYGLPGLGVAYAQDYPGSTRHVFKEEEYLMACGETATVVYDNSVASRAFFSHGGLLYRVSALGVEDEQADCPSIEEMLWKALDSFVLE